MTFHILEILFSAVLLVYCVSVILALLIKAAWIAFVGKNQQDE